MLDLVIADATIVDGTGGPSFPGWVGVEGDEIAAVGGGGEAPVAGLRIEADGAILAPGFVDVHNHSDVSPFVLPTMPSTLHQGVTSVVVGNCGTSPWPMVAWDEAVRLAYADPGEHPPPAWHSWRDYLDAIDEAQPAVNVATLVGHGAIRQQVLGLDAVHPTAEELDRMVGMVRDAVAEGACGVSSGLIYVPGIHSRTDELIAVAAASAAEGGIYASHIRGEGRDLFAAVDEAIAIGEGASVPVHISHLKCESERVRGRANDLLATVHAAGATADQYPYAAWNSSLASLLPPWAPLARIAQVAATEHERLRRAVEDGEPSFQSAIDGVGWDRIVISDTRMTPYLGMDLQAIATDMRCDPFDAMVTMLTQDPDASCIGHAMHEDDVRTILADPEVFVASDASAIDPASEAGTLPVHPRDYGTFPRALARHRDEGLLSLEGAVRTMTSLPSDRFGLHGRGRVAVGTFADLVLFDAGLVRDTATFEAPQVFPEGVRAVVVNGAVAWQEGDGEITRAGRALRRS